jgi:hypothetical protein
MKFRPIRRSAITAGVAGVAALGLVLAAAAAVADTVNVDGDTVATGGNASFSTSAGNCASTVGGAITVTYNSGENHFLAGSPLTLTVDNVPGVNVTIDTTNPTVPADWGTTKSFTIHFHTTITDTLVDGSYQVGINTADSTGYDGNGKQKYNVLVTCGYTVSTNRPPTDPGAPTLDPASVTPNNTGTFSVDWAGSTDPDAGDSVTYTLQKHDASTSSWTTVASGLQTNSYSFTAENEGTYTYQVQASDSHGAASNWATDSTPIVKVDKSAPNQPTASTDPMPAYNDGSSDWYKDSVTVTFAANGDPALQDGSDGSGVASISTTSATYDNTNVDPADGSFSVSSHATDNAGNVSADTLVSGKVDWQAPVVTATCPASAILNQPNVTASWSASDPVPSSGLASGSSGGTVALDTSSVGPHTTTIPAGVAADNVGHTSAQATCNYTVSYNWNGFLQPINDTSHFVGETTSIFKAGSTVPAKFQLTDYYGNVVQAATSPVWIAPVRGNALVSAASVDETVYSTTATAGGVFRWDSTSQQYIYNWNTAKSQGGYYWRIGVVLDDGSTHTVSIGLK